MIYLILKTIHILAVIIFLGNISVGILWKAAAQKTKNPLIINHTFKNLIKADRIFTMPSVTIIIIAGIGLAQMDNMNFLSTGWIFWSIILIILSALSYMVIVVPVQKKIYDLTSNKDFNWDDYYKLSKQWDLWGLIALLTPLLAVVLMVIKFSI